MSKKYDEVDPQVARWLARIAEALNDIGDCRPGYGEFHVSEVVISFDGDETGYRVVPSDDGTFWIGLTR